MCVYFGWLVGWLVWHNDRFIFIKIFFRFFSFSCYFASSIRLCLTHKRRIINIDFPITSTQHIKLMPNTRQQRKKNSIRKRTSSCMKEIIATSLREHKSRYIIIVFKIIHVHIFYEWKTSFFFFITKDVCRSHL